VLEVPRKQVPAELRRLPDNETAEHEVNCKQPMCMQQGHTARQAQHNKQLLGTQPTACMDLPAAIRGPRHYGIRANIVNKVVSAQVRQGGVE
jgi:hypothetical protein